MVASQEHKDGKIASCSNCVQSNWKGNLLNLMLHGVFISWSEVKSSTRKKKTIVLANVKQCFLEK